jgi:hypothetical protein
MAMVLLPILRIQLNRRKKAKRASRFAFIAMNKQKTYAGIGSRQTPDHILNEMRQIAVRLAKAGWVLRSGNCAGADQAFSSAANLVEPSLVELFLPWQGYEANAVVAGNVIHLPTSAAYQIAKRFHPAWRKCSSGARALHARNAQIILGAGLNDPVDEVVCWTANGKLIGGTAMGIRLAQAFGIPVRNLGLVEENVSPQVEFVW